MDIEKLIGDRLEVFGDIGDQLGLIVMDLVHVVVRLAELGFIVVGFIYSLKPLVEKAEGILQSLRKKIKKKQKK